MQARVEEKTDRGDLQERDRLVEENDKLVHYTVRRNFKSLLASEDYEDLVQIGRVGLIKAADRFDITRGYAFSTYAVPMIYGEIQRYARDHSYSMGLKVSRSVMNNKMNAKRYLADHPDASDIEVAEELGITVRDLGRSQVYVSSLDGMISDDVEVSKLSMATTEDELFREAEFDTFVESLIKMAYKFEGGKHGSMLEEIIWNNVLLGDTYTQHELAVKYEVSQAHVSRLLRAFKAYVYNQKDGI